MADYTAEELIAVIDELTDARLTHYIRIRAVQPMISAQGTRFREVDRARVELLCNLSDCYGLDDDALSLVMSLLDEMHGLRGEVQALMQALAREPDDARRRISARIREVRTPDASPDRH